MYGEGCDDAKPKDGSIYLLDFKYDEFIINDSDIIGILEVEAHQYLWLIIEDDVENALLQLSRFLACILLCTCMYMGWNRSLVSDPEAGPYSIEYASTC